MSIASDVISPEGITRCEKLVRPYVRRTPVIEIEAGELGLSPSRLFLKLELLQRISAALGHGRGVATLSVRWHFQ